MSPYALLTGAILTLLAAPLVWIAVRVARDHAVAGAAFVVGVAALMFALRTHLGSRLVDITFGVLGVAGGVLLIATVAGLVAGRRAPRVIARESTLPRARVHR